MLIDPIQQTFNASKSQIRGILFGMEKKKV